MNYREFKNRLESIEFGNMVYSRDFCSFWRWKIEVEKNGRNHVLDETHRKDASKKLVDILASSRWQTYRGISCKPERWLHRALDNLADVYKQIKQYSLLEFGDVPRKHLELVWHELGSVKTTKGVRNTQGEYLYHRRVQAIDVPLGPNTAF